jgi:hypothetical protein
MEQVIFFSGIRPMLDPNFSPHVAIRKSML